MTFSNEHFKEKEGEKYDPPRIDDIKAFADHVVRFSLAGIRAIRDGAQENPAGIE
ncbi:MAG: hypothetical protein AB1401_03760 [Thermodesulfobacteriota bacterium]